MKVHRYAFSVVPWAWCYAWACAQETPLVISNQIEDVIIRAWADPEQCNVDNAKPMNIEEALQLGDSLLGQCIAVDGFWSGSALFVTASDGNDRRSNSVEALRRRRIGVYGTERMLYLAPNHSLKYRLVGIYGRCETEWPGAMMVLGYCHYSGGPILKLSQAIRNPKSRER